MTKKIHVIGGGTFSPIRNHMALSAIAFGNTARFLYKELSKKTFYNDELSVHLHLTKMATGGASVESETRYLVTNDDVAELLETLKADPDTRVIIMNAALCDYDGQVGDVASGSHAQRLKTAEGEQALKLTPAAKLIGEIRKTRKDIFVVGFKTTTNATSQEQYVTALNSLKAGSINLMLANDTVTRNNMIVAPEETRYSETTDRNQVLSKLVEMVLSRSSNTFTRSTVVPGDSIDWNSQDVPENLRTVVNHCINRGAYKPFRGVTAGHFAVRVDDNRILTSKRKTNYNFLSDIGLVAVDYEGYDKVIAHGAKPSVGGQSQRVIFEEHPGLDCIVHAHVPLRADARDLLPLVDQAPNECGSHQCGEATSRGLKDFDGLKAVMLDKHGPNIVFSRDTPPERIIDFIEANFDLSAKTGGLVA
jgi:hypothetical protein